MTQFLNKWIGLVLILFLFNACGGSKKINYKNPKSVTLAFYKALATTNYEQAKQLGTSETVKVISLLQNLNDLLPEEERLAATEEMKVQLKLLKKAICVTKEEESGMVAECQVCCDEQGALGTTPLILKKENHRWLVHMTKESLE